MEEEGIPDADAEHHQREHVRHPLTARPDAPFGVRVHGEESRERCRS